MQTVLGLTGLAGCGKSTVANYLKSKYGFEFLVFSDVLKEEAKRRGLLTGKESLEESKRILSMLGENLRKETGNNAILAVKVIERIKSMGLEKVVVDGFRSPAEVELFRKEFPSFQLFNVFAPAEVRFKRRQLEDHTLTRADFESRDKEDIEKKGLDVVIKMADFTLNNSSDYRSLFLQIDHLMRNVL
ncbi:MAG: AAA family ATPase [Candidatus Aenigmatarchaeota archaeon]